jgi:cupin fold WbuC family metalloprotein
MPPPSHSLALDNFQGDVFRLDEDLIRKGCRAAAESPRQRMIYPIQRTQNAAVQRLMNFLQPETYIRPHQHPGEHASETIQVLQGALGYQVFDDAGNVLQRFVLRAGAAGSVVDIEPGVWHNFVIFEPDTVIIEFKKGPYDAQTDKTFAGWAPDEDQPEAAQMLKQWKEAFS